MDFEWEEEKAKENRRSTASILPTRLPRSKTDGATMPDPASEEEERSVMLGMDALERLLVIAYTWREDRIRRFPRKATRRERRQYQGKRV